MKWISLGVSATILGGAIWAATLIRDGSNMAFDLVHTAASIQAKALGEAMMGVGYLIFVAIAACGMVMIRPRWMALGNALPAAVAIATSAFVVPSVTGAVTLLAVPVALLASAAGVVVCLTRVSILDDLPPAVQVLESTSHLST